MTQEIKTEKFEGLLVKVPDDTIRSTVYMGYLIHKCHNFENGITDEQLADYSKLTKYLKNHNPEKDYKEVAVKLPDGQWKLIGNPFELREDQVLQIIPRMKDSGYPFEIEDWDESWLNTLDMLKVYEVNPYTHPSKLSPVGYNKNKQLWKDAQERTANWVLIQKIG